MYLFYNLSINIYIFKNKQLEIEAYTHKSYCYEHPMTGHHNERLEFLGDSIIGFSISEYLFKKYSNYDEGELSMLKARIVCKTTLASFSLRLGLDKKILLGRGVIVNDKILEDLFEAYIGAIYLDSDK